MNKAQVSDFTGNPQDTTPVYVNEQLSPANKKLFYQANQIRKERNYAYLWFSDSLEQVSCRIKLRSLEQVEYPGRH